MSRPHRTTVRILGVLAICLTCLALAVAVHGTT